MRGFRAGMLAGLALALSDSLAATAKVAGDLLSRLGAGADALMPASPKRSGGHHGWGARRSVLTRNKRSKWTGADIRRMNAVNGVGRPPAVNLARRAR